MGRSDPKLLPFYKRYIKPKGTVALLGFTDNRWFQGDLYDLQLNNWNINDKWKLPKKYDTIISLRCPYFSKDPEDFIARCHKSLNTGGKLYVDWGLGDHWRFKNYKIGWVKDGEHEFAYHEDNYLWSTVWDDSFINDPEYKLFEQRVKKFNYTSVKKVLYDQIPSVCEIKSVKKYFNLSYNMITLWEDNPQLYILLSGSKL